MDAQKFNRLLEKIKYDKKAVDAIYGEYYLKIKAHLSWRFGKLHNAEDMAQEVFLKLMTMETPSYVEYPSVWIYRFADNCAVDFLRRKHEEVKLSEAIRSDFNIDDTILKEDMKRAMHTIDAQSRQILYMHYWEGYSLKEISEVLPIGYANVRAKACRAYKDLKLYFKKSL